jgi:hypothetical protein
VSSKGSTSNKEYTYEELVAHNRIQVGVALVYESVRMFKNHKDLENRYFYYNKEDFKTINND